MLDFRNCFWNLKIWRKNTNFFRFHQSQLTRITCSKHRLAYVQNAQGIMTNVFKVFIFWIDEILLFSNVNPFRTGKKPIFSPVYLYDFIFAQNTLNNETSIPKGFFKFRIILRFGYTTKSDIRFHFSSSASTINRNWTILSDSCDSASN